MPTVSDDVPNFLRFWMNTYASIVGADGKLWEPWQLGNYTKCTSLTTDGGLVPRALPQPVGDGDGQSLWIARATPRVWLEQGKKIAVKNAPTHFGPLAYEIVSDVDNGKITATVEMPSRRLPRDVLVRFRHPKGTPIKSATVNGKAWSDFDPAKEIVRLHDVEGTVKVEAAY